MIYSKVQTVSAIFCGTDAKMSAVGALMLIENALTELTGELHIDGITAMNQYGAVLMYTKNHITFSGSATWKETVTVESFVSCKSTVRFHVDTCIKNAAGEIIVYSRVELCGIDLQTGKIRRIDTLGVDDTVKPESPLCDIRFCRQWEDETAFAETVKVRTSNVDYAHHTNNIEYIKWLVNLFSVSELEEHPVREMEIHFMGQSFEGDELAIYAGKTPDAATFEIKKQGDAVIKCKMLFLKKKRGADI